MLANRFLLSATLLIGATTFLGSMGAADQDFVQRYTLDARARQVSMDAAIAHQEIVLKAFRTLQSEGHASPEEVVVAENALGALVSEQELTRQLIASLDIVALTEPSTTRDADMIMLPIPVVKDFYNAGTASHVGYRLQTDEARCAAAKIKALVEELRVQEASAMHELMGQRYQRLCELNDQSAGGVRERELLKLRQAAFKAATFFDHSGLPILTHSLKKYRVGDEAMHSEDALIRLLAANTTRLRHATQLCQLQHHAELWEHKATMLRRLADSGGTTQGELDYVRSGVDFFRVRTDRLRDVQQDGRLVLTSSETSASASALQAEIEQHSRQQWQEVQRIKNECVSLSGLMEKLRRLAANDSYFARELASVQRSLTVAQAEAAAMSHAEAVHEAAIAFVETQSPPVDATVMVSSQSLSAALRTVFQLEADNSCEVAVVNARIAMAEVRVEALRELHQQGFASWWESASAEASLRDLRTEIRRLDIVRQIGALRMQIVEDGEPVFPQAQPLAMSR